MTEIKVTNKRVKKIEVINDGRLDGLYKRKKNRYIICEGYCEVEMTLGKKVKVDKEDMKYFEDRLWRFQPRLDKTKGSFVGGKKNEEGVIEVSNLHRVIMGIGKKNIGYDVGYKNGDETDLRKENLVLIDADERRKRVVSEMRELKEKERIDKIKEEIKEELEEEEISDEEEYEEEFEKRLAQRVNKKRKTKKQ